MSIFNRDNFQVLTSPLGLVMTVLVIAAVGSLWLFGGGPDNSGQTYYYDLEVGKVFTADVINELPPIRSELTGKDTGAYIFIFSCGSCEDYDGMTPEEIEAAGGIPAYLAIYSDRARAAFKQTGQIRDFSAGRLVKRISDEKWLPSGSLESTLNAEAKARCGNGKANGCQP